MINFSCSLLLSILVLGCSSSDPDTNDPCDGVTCQNGGECVNGTCDCPDGFEDGLCEIAIDACEDIECQNGGECVDGTCACPEGFEGKFCETAIDLCNDVECQNGGECVDGTCACPDGFEGEFCEIESLSLELRTEFGSVDELEVRTQGIFAIWWNPKFDHSNDAEQMFKILNGIRAKCIDKLDMMDPPNPAAGYYYNVYIHHGKKETVFPEWGNGQGTDIYGMPYLTLPVGAYLGTTNLAHEGFHIFQYSATSPGFSYSGDSQWYIETSAQWFKSAMVPDDPAVFIEAGAISANPQLALWHSFTNEAPGDPVDWAYQVRQYGMHLLLYYMTEVASVNPEIFTSGFYAGTALSPQEYIYTHVGGNLFRKLFADWSAHNTLGFDYISEQQREIALYELKSAADPDNIHPYVLELNDGEANGTFFPPNELITRGWSYNVIKINNSANAKYTFDLTGEANGSEGGQAHFEGRIIVKYANGTARLVEIDMDTDISGSGSVEVASDDTEIYVTVVSVPEHFSGNQTYNYELSISRE